jgi:hypothetical protein
MIVKLHKTGTSFVGATRYVMHDKRAATSHRVQWAETVNVGTDDPHAAAKVMAFVAMDANRLKSEAGVAAGGRKSNQHVLHATLSWTAAEAPTLTKQHQLEAAAWFLKKLGAEDRQAIIVAHNDQKNAPHIHLIVNRCSTLDGRMLSSSFEKMKSSEWALAYERSRGEIHCHQRAINAKARERGHYVRGRQDEARHFQEMRQRAGNNPDLLAQVEAEKSRMKRAYHALKEAEREAKRRQAEIDRKHRGQYATLRSETRREINKSKQRVRDSFADAWAEEYFEAETQKAAFELREKHILGRGQNALRGVRWQDLIGKDRIRGQRRGVLAEAFGALGDAGKRLELLKRQQDYREQLLRQKQNFAMHKAVQETRREAAAKLQTLHRQYTAERQRHDEQARRRQVELTAAVRQVGRERYRNWTQALNEQKRQAQTAAKTHATKPQTEEMKQLRQPVREQFNAAAHTTQDRIAGEEKRAAKPSRQKTTSQNAAGTQETIRRDSQPVQHEPATAVPPETRPQDVLPQNHQAVQIARQMDEHKRLQAFHQQMEAKRQQDQSRGGQSF